MTPSTLRGIKVEKSNLQLPTPVNSALETISEMVRANSDWVCGIGIGALILSLLATTVCLATTYL
jgi:hypothetical protein